MNLAGQYFTVHTAAGESVSKGQCLLSFDAAAIVAAGYDLTTPLVVTNAADFGSIEFIAADGQSHIYSQPEFLPQSPAPLAAGAAGTAAGILEHIGGSGNIRSMEHCATRLRLILKDKSQFNAAAVEAVPGVKGQFFAASQYQIILGTGFVNKVYEEMLLLVPGLSSSHQAEAYAEMSLVQKISRTFGDVFVPIIPVLVATGLFMGLRGMAQSLGIVFNENFLRLSQILTDTAFAFLPALVTWSTMKKFGGTPVIGIVLGLMLVAPQLPNAYAVAGGQAQVLTMAFTLVSLVLVLAIGVEVNGSKRWLGLGFMQFQPSEMAKLVSIVMAAAYLGPRIDRGQPINLKNVPAGVFVVMAVLIELQPDMGTMMLVIGIPMLMYVLAGMRTKWVVILAGLAAAAIVFLSFLQPYRLERIKTWYDPWQYQQNQGYQTVQSMSAIGSGGLFGMGLGKGVSKYYYLPEAHTDFAFAIFCQENGYLGAFFVFFLLLALAVYSAKIASRATDGFGRMLAIGVLILIVGQGVANVAMVVGLLPVVGVPLPFISYGGTSLILNMVGIGFLVNVGRYADRQPKPAQLPAEPTSPKRRLRLVKK